MRQGRRVAVPHMLARDAGRRWRKALTSRRMGTQSAATAAGGSIFTRLECLAAACHVSWWSCRTSGLLLSQPHDERFKHEAGAVAGGTCAFHGEIGIEQPSVELTRAVAAELFQ